MANGKGGHSRTLNTNHERGIRVEEGVVGECALPLVWSFFVGEGAKPGPLPAGARTLEMQQLKLGALTERERRSTQPAAGQCAQPPPRGAIASRCWHSLARNGRFRPGRESRWGRPHARCESPHRSGSPGSLLAPRQARATATASPCGSLGVPMIGSRRPRMPLVSHFPSLRPRRQCVAGRCRQTSGRQERPSA